MISNSLSKRIFIFLETAYFSEHKKMIESLGSILNLQKSTIYKKVQGESSLTLEEVHKICLHFVISLDEILGLNDNKIYFDFPALKGIGTNAVDYLKPIAVDLEKVHSLKPHVFYATRELPIFYYFSSVYLASFKFFVFHNIIWREDKYAIIKFDINQYQHDTEFTKLLSQITDSYMNLNSTEIWNVQLIDNTLNQIKYFLESGLFQSPQDAIKLCHEIHHLVDRIAKMMSTGNKSVFKLNQSQAGQVNIVNNEITHTNNVIFVNSETLRAVYNTYDNPNFMKSYNSKLCDYTEQWINRLIINAAPLTQGSIKDQNNFINKFKERIDKTIIFIEAYIQNNS